MKSGQSLIRGLVFVIQEHPNLAEFCLLLPLGSVYLNASLSTSTFADIHIDTHQDIETPLISKLNKFLKPNQPPSTSPYVITTPIYWDQAWCTELLYGIHAVFNLQHVS